MGGRFCVSIVAFVVGVSGPWLAVRSGAQPQVSVFFGNLHSHTALSDGSGTPAEAYEHARDTAGLDFLAITEHNHAQQVTSPKTLSCIPDRARCH